MSNRVTHFEIPCNDPEKTMPFLSQPSIGTFNNWAQKNTGLL